MSFRTVLRFVFSVACFFAGWILAEGGVFAYPGIWLMDADSQLLKALGGFIALALSFVGLGVCCLPLLPFLFDMKEQNNIAPPAR